MPEPSSLHDAVFVRDRASQANDQAMLQVLRAYCLGMLKACGYVNERIRSEHFYEVTTLSSNIIFADYNIYLYYPHRRRISYQTHIIVLSLIVSQRKRFLRS